MKAIHSATKAILIRLIAFSFVVLAATCTPTLGQNGRIWLAGRYDGNRVLVYFDAVKFEGTMTPNARKIPPPVADAFFEPVELPPTYIARFQKTPNAEHFAIGDRYDLLLGNGMILTIKLTTLVGCETDEPVGNDSYVGALGTVEDKDYWGFLTKGYFAVRRHQEPQSHAVAKSSVLLDEPVQFDLEAKLMELLNSKMKIEATEAKRKTIGDISPRLKVQPFQMADGSLRYYVRAGWEDPTGTSSYLLAAWVTPLPTLRILAVDQHTSPYGSVNDGLPDLLNVIDLGNGETGVIFNIRGEDNTKLILAEYRDGLNAQKMPVIQSIGAGE